MRRPTLEGLELPEKTPHVDSGEKDLRNRDGMLFPVLLNISKNDIAEMQSRLRNGENTSDCNAVAIRLRRLIPWIRHVSVVMKSGDAVAHLDSMQISLGNDIFLWLEKAIREEKVLPTHWLIELPGNVLPSGPSRSEPLRKNKS